MKESAVSEKTWEEIEKELFTAEEIVASDQRIAEISKQIRARTETETQGKE